MSLKLNALVTVLSSNSLYGIIPPAFDETEDRTSVYKPTSQDLYDTPTSGPLGSVATLFLLTCTILNDATKVSKVESAKITSAVAAAYDALPYTAMCR